MRLHMVMVKVVDDTLFNKNKLVFPYHIRKKNNLHDFFDSVNGNLFRLAIVAYDPLFALGGRPRGSNLIKTF